MTEPIPTKPPHKAIDPPSLAAPVGYTNGVLASPGRTLYLAGQVGWDKESRFPDPHDLAKQVDLALGNLLAVVTEAGGKPEHLVSMRIYALSAEAWRANAKAIGLVWKKRMGKVFPAMALVEVKRLFEPEALVEIEGVAVVP